MKANRKSPKGKKKQQYARKQYTAMEHVLQMNMKSGSGESSYASNSILQRKVMLKAWPVVEDTIRDMYKGGAFQPKCFSIADMGSSSGPNTPLVISNIIGIVVTLCRQENCPAPDEFQVSLNDLPENDFNTLFRSLLPFYDNLKKENGDIFKRCFISGVPNSFYERLFPTKSLHFVHSSYSLHWLSQIPQGLVNKGNIYMDKTCRPDVFQLYFKQYEKDFSAFLRARSEEMVQNGRMVLTFIGRSIADPSSKDCCLLWALLGKSLYNIAAEGLVEESAVDSFNLPIYTPYKDEVKALVQKEGSFDIYNLQTFEVNWDAEDDNDDNDFSSFDKESSGRNGAKCIRAVTEPMLLSHFGVGSSTIERVFVWYARHVAEHLAVEKTKYFNIAISLSKK